MKISSISFFGAVLLFLHCSPLFAQAQISSSGAPAALQAWEGWVLWNNPQRDCPPQYQNADKRLGFWPSELALDLGQTGGSFDYQVTIYKPTWILLPGNVEAWPQGVRANNQLVPVLPHENLPTVFLPSGKYRLQGNFTWSALPQNLLLPREIGLLRLRLLGKDVEFPAWNADGRLWLRRDRVSTEAAQDSLSLKAFARLEDGIPLWLETEVELIVSGKSREENLGLILPADWKLTQVESAIPVAVDDAGKMKAQVRAGKWTIRLKAFRLDNPKSFAFDGEAAIKELLVGLKSKPDFRSIEVVGTSLVDVSQTTFPAAWRNLPVYRWNTAEPFRIEERMRGMGEQQPGSLSITREWWLDETGRKLTFRDRLTGQRQEVWRLDVAQGLDLGAVRADGAGQLITRNPETGTPGVEVRSRTLNLEATGTMKRTQEMSATGWKTNAEGVNVTLNLPPGWRLFALFGADWVKGDWLTAWSLLDLFLLLIFSFGVLRLYGFFPALLAFFAFALSYQELGAPHYTWLVLLLPIALLRVVPAGKLQFWVTIWKWATVFVLICILVPFLAMQIQQALHPQLEKTSQDLPPAPPPGAVGFAAAPAPAEQSDSFSLLEATTDRAALPRKKEASRGAGLMSVYSNANLLNDSKARIQTGPGVPDWRWRSVSFGWNGPVQDSQMVEPILIPLGLERFLTVLRIALLLLLAFLLIRPKYPFSKTASTPPSAPAIPPPLPALVILLIALGSFLAPATASAADFPAPEMLKELQERLLKPAEVFPNAAEIPNVALRLDGRRLHLSAEIHAGARVAVPLPGKLPTWSPISVSVDGKAQSVVMRNDGFLWVVLESGVHQVEVEGLIGDVAEWEWTFQLRPRKVTIEAPGWTFSGIQPNGIPEQQVFFIRQDRKVGAEAAYDRQDFQTLAVVDRHLELGLVWQVRTTVTRLSPAGKAISLRIPLLEGERVLTANAVLKDSKVEVRLGAQATSYSWVSELAVVPKIAITSQASEPWVEKWHLMVSPVWNISFQGLAPVFTPEQKELIPVWHPWPGESVELTISRPEAIPGATVTVNQVREEITLGQRQRTSQLTLAIRASLGEDFLITVPEGAEVTGLTHDAKTLPVRKEGRNVFVPLRPGDQSVSLSWRSKQSLDFQAQAEPVALPVESANVSTVMHVPDDCWVLSTEGALRGPAVRFWGILVAALLAAFVLGRIPATPLRTVQWALLAIGLTQVPLPASFVVIGWLFFLVWRGSDSFATLNPRWYNFFQVFLAGLTLVTIFVFLAIAFVGLLGNPEMFIEGNGSSRTLLQWYQASSGKELPQPAFWSVSIWWYRLLMLLWALWLATSLLQWLQWGWQKFSQGTCWKKTTKMSVIPPIP